MNRFARTSLVPALILAAILAGGAVTVWGLAVGIVGGGYLGWKTDRQVQESLRITSSGQPVLELWRAGSRQSHQFYDLNRQPVRLPQPNEYLRGCFLPKAQYLSQGSATARFSILGLSGGHSAANWFLQYGDDRQHAYLVAFDSQSKHCVGYIGVSGLRLDQPPLDDQFAIGERSLNVGSQALHSRFGRIESSNNQTAPIVIISDDKLYLIDLRAAEALGRPYTQAEADRADQTVRLLSLSEPVVSMAFAPKPADSEAREQQRIVVRTSKHVWLLGLDGETLRSVSIPPAYVDRQFTVRFPPGDEILFEDYRIAPGSREIDLTWVDTKSAAIRSEHVTLRTQNDYVWQIIWLGSAIVPSPAVLASCYGFFLTYDQHPFDDSLTAAKWTQIQSASWPPFLLVCLASAVAAAFTYRRQRRYGPRGAVAWAIFVLIVGPAGLLGYLWHRRWPVLEHCASCGADAPRDRGDCVACHTEFPAPRQLGCEVFA